MTNDRKTLVPARYQPPLPDSLILSEPPEEEHVPMDVVFVGGASIAARAAGRAMLHAVGFTRADFKKPQVGVCSTWSQVTPCNVHIDELARFVDPTTVVAPLDHVRDCGGAGCSQPLQAASSESAAAAPIARVRERVRIGASRPRARPAQKQRSRRRGATSLESAPPHP